MGRVWRDTSQKKISKWPVNIWKDGNITFQGNWNQNHKEISFSSTRMTKRGKSEQYYGGQWGTIGTPLIIFFSIYKKIQALGYVAQLVGALFLKGSRPRFSVRGQPRLQVRSPVRACARGNQLMFLTLMFLFLPSPLSKKNKNKNKHAFRWKKIFIQK